MTSEQPPKSLTNCLSDKLTQSAVPPSKSTVLPSKSTVLPSKSTQTALFIPKSPSEAEIAHVEKKEKEKKWLKTAFGISSVLWCPIFCFLMFSAIMTLTIMALFKTYPYPKCEECEYCSPMNCTLPQSGNYTETGNFADIDNYTESEYLN